jgi:ADP-ribosylglycohydrolase
MLGAIAGDIIGSVHEFQNMKGMDFPLFSFGGDRNSIFTDDTVLTVATCEVLLTGADYATVYKAYAKRFPSAGWGSMFNKWVYSSDAAPYNSFGNGSAMRVSPIAWAFNSAAEVLAEAKKSAEVTHNHEEGIKGAQAAALATFMARMQFSKEDIRDIVSKKFGYDLNRTCEIIRPAYKFDASCQGSVPESIIAFLDSTDYESAIRLAVSLGGDADTMACIAGGIARAFYPTMPKEIATMSLKLLPKKFLTVIRDFYKKFNIKVKVSN